MMVKFFEPMRIPKVTHNDLEPRRGKGGRHYIGKSAELQEAEQSWEAHLTKHTPPEPFRGAVAVAIDFVFGTTDVSKMGAPKVTKPDNDNLEKTVFDAMGRLGWFARGDQQIAYNATTKYYDRIEGVMVVVADYADYTALMGAM